MQVAGGLSQVTSQTTRSARNTTGTPMTIPRSMNTNMVITAARLMASHTWILAALVALHSQAHKTSGSNIAGVGGGGKPKYHTRIPLTVSSEGLSLQAHRGL